MYSKVVFLHFYAESNEMTKYLDQVRLKVERHPHFAFFREGTPSAQCSAMGICMCRVYLRCFGKFVQVCAAISLQVFAFPVFLPTDVCCNRLAEVLVHWSQSGEF